LNPILSVIVCTYNPNPSILNDSLEALKRQSLPTPLWELIIVDNGSTNNAISKIDLSWHKSTRLILEKKQGLTFARIAGFRECRGQYIVLVDDDNILESRYLEIVVESFHKNPLLGAIGGKSIPIFLIQPPSWATQFFSDLALRDLGDHIIIERWDNTYPQSGPLGAGMALRNNALKPYISKISSNKVIISDRVGSSLSSGGDNDIVLEILKSGWETAYIPRLSLHHIIPESRLSVRYLSRLTNNSSKSWVQLLESHGINPWEKISPWTVPFRKVKSWFIYKAWYNKVNYIKWRGACGIYEGLAEPISAS
jgi:glycosyltransferase involved in cell wall biosynthesis